MPAFFPLWVVITHFLNIFFLLLLARSGLEVLSAFPKLYWHDDCPPGREWARFSRTMYGADSRTMWSSLDEEEAWSPVVALPGRKNLGLGRHWHFMTVQFWILTGVVYVALVFATGYWHYLVPTRWAIIPDSVPSRRHLPALPDPGEDPGRTLRARPEARLLPGDLRAGPLPDRHGGGDVAVGAGPLPVVREAVRREAGCPEPALPRAVRVRCVHRGARGPGRRARAAGRAHRHRARAPGWKHDPRGRAGGGRAGRDPAGPRRRRLVLVAPPAPHAAGARPGGRPVRAGAVADVHLPAAVPPDRHLALPPGERLPARRCGLRAAGRRGLRRLPAGRRGLVEQPTELSLAQLRGFDQQAQIVKHNCIQGWTAVAEWSGVPLRAVLDRVGVQDGAKFVVFYAMDDKGLTEGEVRYGYFYGSIPLQLAGNPQTILALDMNGAPLPIEHGAPVRLRVETQLGFKMVKWINAIELVADLADIGMGMGGWREDQQFYASAAGI